MEIDYYKIIAAEVTKGLPPAQKERIIRDALKQALKAHSSAHQLTQAIGDEIKKMAEKEIKAFLSTPKNQAKIRKAVRAGMDKAVTLISEASRKTILRAFTGYVEYPTTEIARQVRAVFNKRS